MKGNGAGTAPFEKKIQAANRENGFDTGNNEFNPKAISNSPIIRVMTLMPVWPNRRTSQGAMRNSPSSTAQKRNRHKKAKQVNALW
jgi:hypothetical protein